MTTSVALALAVVVLAVIIVMGLAVRYLLTREASLIMRRTSKSETRWVRWLFG